MIGIRLKSQHDCRWYSIWCIRMSVKLLSILVFYITVKLVSLNCCQTPQFNPIPKFKHDSNCHRYTCKTIAIQHKDDC